MPGFANPLETWNARFAGDDYLFGEEPNDFVQREAPRLPRGATVLCVADGEGRNSVWLAQQGHAVTAFDFAPNAVAKAKRLAAMRGVTVDHQLGDVYDWPWTAAQYDAVVVVFIQFVPPEERAAVFAGLRAANACCACSTAASPGAANTGAADNAPSRKNMIIRSMARG